METLKAATVESLQRDTNNISDIIYPWSSDLHDEEADPQPSAFEVSLSFMN